MAEELILGLPFKMFFHNAPTGLALVDLRGRILIANPAFTKLLRCDVRDIIRQDFLSFIPGDKADDVRTLIDQAVMGASQNYQKETLVICQDGKSLNIILGAALVQDTMGKPLCIMITLSEMLGYQDRRKNRKSPPSNVAEYKTENESAPVQAWHDAITGQNNSVLFQERLRHAIRRAEREGKILGVLFLDLDQFKRLNDSFGSHAGNQLLRDAGTRIADSVRKSDTVARHNLDRYTILLEGLDMAEHVSSVAQKLINIFVPPFQWRGQDVYLTASIGISVYPMDGIDGDSLIKNAESAMHQAKNDGGNAFQFYTQELNTRARERVKLDSDLHRALKHGEFALHYQPVINITRNEVSCFEALVRWHHPEKGLQPPLSFIPTLEETGLIVPVGEWILRTACQQLKALQTNGHSGLRMAVNISGRQLLQKDFAQSLDDILRETGLDPHALELEITESVLIRDTAGSAKILSSLVDLGIRIALDDFGTGYSPLSNLKRFPINTLKIDRFFIQGVPQKQEDVAITNAILTLSTNLGMKAVAEGVETKEQLAFLRERGCRELQGFLFAKPIPADELNHWLHNRAH